MKRIFYSWQADRLKTTGRNLVNRALVDAIHALKTDADVEDAEREDVFLDSDTQNVPGSPPIAETIFRKIDTASVFVADLTFVGTRSDGRPVPNPNVTIEYGYALKALTHARVIGIMNAAHGEPTRESLPFDLGHMRRPITYNCPDDADDEGRRRARKQLADELKGALKAILALDVDDQGEADAILHEALPALNGDARFRSVQDPVGMLFDGSLLPQPDVPVFLAPGAAMWLRVIPKFSTGRTLLVTSLREALINKGHMVRPLNGEDYLNPYGIRGEDGFGLGILDDGKRASMLVYAFNNGEVWSLDTLMLKSSNDRLFFNPGKYVRALIEFSDMLKGLGIDGPYRWIAGIDGMKGRHLAVIGRAYTFSPPACLGEKVIVEGEYSGDAREADSAIEPFIARVFDAGHLSR
ncbi:UNVERIFIED_ORG: hypothetical protein J2Y81_008094 [Paraburkholderia sediminicola]|nr:hypothetical protein [Paraburkholderia sediminicola]